MCLLNNHLIRSCFMQKVSGDALGRGCVTLQKSKLTGIGIGIGAGTVAGVAATGGQGCADG